MKIKHIAFFNNQRHWNLLTKCIHVFRNIINLPVRNFLYIDTFSSTLLVSRSVLWHTEGPLRGVVSPSHGLYIHKTTRYKEAKQKQPRAEQDSNRGTTTRVLKARGLDSGATGSAVVKINSNCFLRQHCPNVLCNGTRCFLWGTN
jgi:hypothetical protein